MSPCLTRAYSASSGSMRSQIDMNTAGAGRFAGSRRARPGLLLARPAPPVPRASTAACTRATAARRLGPGEAFSGAGGPGSQRRSAFRISPSGSQIGPLTRPAIRSATTRASCRAAARAVALASHRSLERAPFSRCSSSCTSRSSGPLMPPARHSR